MAAHYYHLLAAIAMVLCITTIQATSVPLAPSFDEMLALMPVTGVNYTWHQWTGPTCPDHLYNVMPLKNLTLTHTTRALKLADALAEDFVNSWYKKENATTGLVFTIVFQDQVLLSKGYGHINASSSSPAPDQNSVMRIGSISKIFTSLMLMQALDRSVVELDDPVTKYWNEQRPPAFNPPNPYSSDLSGRVQSTHTHTHTHTHTNSVVLINILVVACPRSDFAFTVSTFWRCFA
jgi:CubicO group peptidase (beta-lactamase class C family)